MTLTFPTMAEQALTEFRSATKTVSLATICRRRRAEVIKHFTFTEYVFDDDTSLQVTGRGKAHQVTTHLP